MTVRQFVISDIDDVAEFVRTTAVEAAHNKSVTLHTVLVPSELHRDTAPETRTFVVRVEIIHFGESPFMMVCDVKDGAHYAIVANADGRMAIMVTD